jgi:hypothetical protein
MKIIFKKMSSLAMILTACMLINYSASAQFRAAVVKVDITPEEPQQMQGYPRHEKKSEGVLDRLYHRIIALDDGKNQLFIVSSDICLIAPSEYDHMAEILKKQLGIEPINFLWACTHTHSGPEVGPQGLAAIFLGDRYKHELDPKYTPWLEQKMLEGIKEAKQKMAPARLGVGWGFSQASINRRAVDEKGEASLGLNPDGPVDRRIGLMRIDKEDGSPLALIANYPIHGTVLGPSMMKFSGDAPGVVAEYVQEKTGVPMLFINGAEGNLAPIYSVYPDEKAGHLSEFKVLLGDKILDANKKITSTTNKVNLKLGSITVETPRKAGMGWTKELAAYTKTTSSGQNMVKLPIRFININDEIAIWAAPLELFCEVSNEVRDRSPYPFTFYYGLSNGWLGYMLPENEYKHGGYEPEVSPYTSSAARDMTEAVVTYLKAKK